jgi:hypothetical protein
LWRGFSPDLRCNLVRFANDIWGIRTFNLAENVKFRIDNRTETFACHDHCEAAAMTNGFDPGTVLEILRMIASVGLWATVVIILAWQSPKLLQVILSFVRNVIKDFRTPPRRRVSKHGEGEKPSLGKMRQQSPDGSGAKG